MTFLLIVLAVVLIGAVVAIVALLGPVTRRMTGTSGLTPEQRVGAVTGTRTMLMQVGSVITAALALAGMVGTFWYNSQTVSLEIEKQFQARYDKAVQDLRSDVASIRVTSLYELEDLARDAPSYAWKVTTTISAYLQDRARGEKTARPHLTVQAALTVLGHRDRRTDRGTVVTGPLDADGVTLSKADLSGMDLRGIDLAEAVLDRADFTGADLREARFTKSDVREADFTGARLDGAAFDDALSDGAVGLPGPGKPTPRCPPGS
ncbi:pentapeptide repeat-containing protein [Nonomuraea sp. M3C6]|uniref:Pentapeptide repeat-containing protein n=1 Tax=Nonomuraea marmarensis TaxID=3351344 RepID=A0ABW7ASX5_9ACTN